MSKKARKPTLEEMVDDLQRSSRERREGEDEPKLVVRSDGSEMMRVRKRKRRSKQPGKEAAKKRRKTKYVIISCSIALMLLMVMVGAISYGYHNSKAFQDKVQQTVEGKTGAQAELGYLSVGIGSAQLSDVSLDWSEADGAIKSLKLEKVTASYGPNGFLGGSWNLSGINAAEGQLVLRSVADPELKDKGGASLSMTNEYIQCSNLDIYFGEFGRIPDIDGSSVTLKTYESDPPQLSLSGGMLNLKPFKGLLIENGLIKLHPTFGDLQLRVTDENRFGVIAMEGAIPMNANKPAKLNATLQEFPVERLLSNKTQRFFQGRIDSKDAVLEINPRNLNDLDYSMNFTSSYLKISGFPFLRGLSELLDRKWYESPSFDRNIKGEMIRSGNQLKISNLSAEDNKYLKIEGNFIVEEDGKVSGDLKISIREESANFRGRVPKGIFSRPFNGYVSTNVKLGGNVHEVTDDFMSRIEEAQAREEEAELNKPQNEFEAVVPVAPKGNEIEQEFFGE